MFGNILIQHKEGKGKGIWRLYGLNSGWSIGTFYNKGQLDRYARMFGFSYRCVEKDSRCSYYVCDKAIVDDLSGGFTSLGQLPAGVKPFKALSNGSIVDCYYLVSDCGITIFRPNPNYPEVYSPMCIDEAIRFHRRNGIY